jgi:hypothetical protein
LLRVICHHRPSVHQSGAERSPPDARPNASPGRDPCDATRPRTRSLGKLAGGLSCPRKPGLRAKPFSLQVSLHVMRVYAIRHTR